jgi:hypothetical protein
MQEGSRERVFSPGLEADISVVCIQVSNTDQGRHAEILVRSGIALNRHPSDIAPDSLQLGHSVAARGGEHAIGGPVWIRSPGPVWSALPDNEWL